MRRCKLIKKYIYGILCIGMMDIALLTANTNQLRYVMAYSSASTSYQILLGLIITSMIIQICVGLGFIFEVRI